MKLDRLIWLFAVLAFVASAAKASSIFTLTGEPAELVLSQVSERTVRVQLSPLAQRAGGRSDTDSNVLVPFRIRERLRVRELARERELRLGRLRVRLHPAPLTVAVRMDGRLVQELVFDQVAATNAGVTFLTRAMVLGLGEGAQQFDRRGALYPMEPTWGGWNRPVLGSVVPSPLVIGTDGWALFAHQPAGQFDLRQGRGRFTPHPATNGLSAPLDFFVIALDEPGDALAEYIRLTGRPVLPPKWALGYFQSHRTLAGPEEPLEIARNFRERSLPCDALIYLGTGYCTNGWNTGHGSLSFNSNAFGADTLQALHDLNFKVVLHVNRAPQDLYGSFSDELRPSANALAAPAGSNPAGIAGSRSHIRDYWARHQAIFGLGVDGWWPDDGDELPLAARLTRHLCYYEGALLDRPNVRPWSLHRTGYAGAQRYGGWIWSGDTDSKWETLAAQIAVGLNHGLSLTPFWGSDTGGFFPTPELTGELFVRWFQFSAFCPSFRSHGRTWKLRLPWGWNTGEFGPIEHPERQHPPLDELHNAAVEPICRQYLELRYRLLAYNYTLAREAVDTGLPMMRALWLHYPEDPEAVRLGDEYLWGRDLLVAPVVAKGAASRRVYLPAGEWYDWWTHQRHSGQRWIERPVDLATLPLFVRAGAVLPLDPVRQFTAQTVNEPTTVRVFPGVDGEFTLYDDDGQSLNYRNAADPAARWIRFRWDNDRRLLTIEADPRMRKWPGGERRFAVEVAGGAVAPSRLVSFSGKRLRLAF